MLQALVKAASWSFLGCCTILYALLTVKSVVRGGGWGLITSFLRLCNLMLTWQILFQFKCKTRDGTAIIFISCSPIWYRSFFLWLIEERKSVKTRKICFFLNFKTTTKSLVSASPILEKHYFPQGKRLHCAFILFHLKILMNGSDHGQLSLSSCEIFNKWSLLKKLDSKTMLLMFTLSVGSI